jgi:hypothetical protein
MVSWVVVIGINIIIALTIEVPLWKATAAAAGAGWIVLTLLFLQVTRKPRQGIAEARSGMVVLEEPGTWWQRISLAGRLRMRVDRVDTPFNGTVTVICQDAVWGPIQITFKPEVASDVQAILAELKKPVSAAG